MKPTRTGSNDAIFAIVLPHRLDNQKPRTALTPKVEPVIYGFLRSKAIGLEGTLFALNGTLDHTHMVVSIPPKIAVATFIGQVKGVASTKFNKSGLSDTPFFWQEEYGIFSFDGKRLPNYIAYVENQKKHHAENNLLHVLERSDNGIVQMAREQQAQYVTSTANWWSEMQALNESCIIARTFTSGRQWRQRACPPTRAIKRIIVHSPGQATTSKDGLARR